jgi:hypothetical protein
MDCKKKCCVQCVLAPKALWQVNIKKLHIILTF